MMQQYTYRPKGGMCRSCKMIKDDCSKLDFKSMPVIYRAISEPITYIIVKCTNFERKVKNDELA